MEPVNLMVARKVVADEVRRSAAGQDREKIRRNAPWSALWRRVTRRRAAVETQAPCPRLVSESPGD
ncbi:hypothetical protein GCM10009744_40410 [Kribbella alba]|uniref:Uncharacterized protein n=1 Tax=Kribbella alba TaxID=190197 RepID=A0ABN2FG88_9ACTN